MFSAIRKSQLSVIKNHFSIPLNGVPQIMFSSTATRSVYFDNVVVTDGVAVFTIDGPNKVNTITGELREELVSLWEKNVASNPNVKAVVFISGKKDNFIAGADIDMLKAVKDKKDLKDLCLLGHSTFDMIKKSKLPIVAAIDGTCLGGGLEWTLNCDYRICTTNKKTQLGLPEVQLGLLPGWGGTQNLPKTVGLQAALDMILTGKKIRPDKALKMGLVDLVVDPIVLKDVAISTAKGLADGTVKRKTKKAPLMTRLLEGTSAGRSIVFHQAKKMVAKNAGTHYPAPFAILDVMEKGYSLGRKEALEYEATKFSELAATKESEALISLFDGMTDLKKNRFGEPSRNVKTIAIMGAGLMGAGIAQVSAERGYKILLKDRNAESVGKGESYIKTNMDTNVKKKKMANYERSEVISKIYPLTDDSEIWKTHMATADLTIEAVFEDLVVKQNVMKQSQLLMPAHGIFASNTSSISIGKIAEVSERPENVIGMHYFSPVPMMQLMEVIPHQKTSKDTCSIATAVGIKQGKIVIVVKDVAGFYVNRCLGPQLVEVSALAQSGVTIEELDRNIKALGMPMGPFALADEVGLDVVNHVQSFLSKADLGVRMTGGNPELMALLVKEGFLGKKNGKGFYIHDKGKGGGKKLNNDVVSKMKQYTTGKTPASAQEQQERYLARFVNEAIFCLQDGVISNPTDGDIGAVFGVGFLPFTGGPFRMVDSYGISKYHDLLNRYADKYGEQFRPATLLSDMVKQNKKFYN